MMNKALQRWPQGIDQLTTLACGNAASVTRHSHRGYFSRCTCVQTSPLTPTNAAIAPNLLQILRTCALTCRSIPEKNLSSAASVRVLSQVPQLSIITSARTLERSPSDVTNVEGASPSPLISRGTCVSRANVPPIRSLQPQNTEAIYQLAPNSTRLNRFLQFKAKLKYQAERC